MKRFKKIFSRDFFEISDDEHKLKRRPLNLSKILTFALGGVAIVYLATFLIFVLWKWPNEPGTLGDSFGMVNALFSALAFAFLIYTSLLQTEELKLQRQELKENREELARTADAQDAQLKIQMLVHADVIEPEIDINLTYAKWIFKDSTQDQFRIMGVNVIAKSSPILVQGIFLSTHKNKNIIENSRWIYRNKTRTYNVPYDEINDDYIEVDSLEDLFNDNFVNDELQIIYISNLEVTEKLIVDINIYINDVDGGSYLFTFRGISPKSVPKPSRRHLRRAVRMESPK